MEGRFFISFQYTVYIPQLGRPEEVMDRESALRAQRRRYSTHLGFAVKELEHTRYGVKVVKEGATRDVWGSEI